MPPTIDQWLEIPRLGIYVLVTFWPYASLVCEIILGLELIKWVMSAIRQFRDLGGE